MFTLRVLFGRNVVLSKRVSFLIVGIDNRTPFEEYES